MNKKSPAQMAIIDLCQHYLRYLRKNRNNEIEYITALSNGFEDWLKFEFCIMCAKNTKWFWKPKIDYGFEYSARLKNRCSRHESKIIDIWTRGKKRNHWHYIEFKDVFKKYNQKNQVYSWIDDFEILQNNLKKNENVDGKASLIFGVGFEEDSWKKSINSRVPKKYKSHLHLFKNVSTLSCAALIV